MKKMLGLMLSTALLATTTACSSSSTSDVELNTVSMWGGENTSAEIYQDIITDFETETGITVNDESEGSSEEWKVSVRTDFQVGNEPDVLFYFTGSEAEPMIEAGQLVDIETIRSEYPDYGKNISNSAMSFMEEKDGLSYALPVRGFWEGLLVNEDLFEEYGLELPTTWDSFITAIETFAATDITPLAASFSDEPHYLIEHLILAYGGVEEHQKTLVPSEVAPTSWVEGLDLLTELDSLGAFADNVSSTTESDAKQLFIDKKAAMLVEGSWLTSKITDQENTTVISFPSYTTNKKEATDIVGGFSSGFYITKKAWDDPEKRDAAVQFVETMTSNESIEKFASAGGAPAASVNVSTELTPVQADGVQMSSDATNIVMPIDSRINKIAWEYIIDNIPAIVEGTTDSRQVLDHAANLNNE